MKVSGKVFGTGKVFVKFIPQIELLGFSQTNVNADSRTFTVTSDDLTVTGTSDFPPSIRLNKPMTSSTDSVVEFVFGGAIPGADFLGPEFTSIGFVEAGAVASGNQVGDYNLSVGIMRVQFSGPPGYVRLQNGTGRTNLNPSPAGFWNTGDIVAIARSGSNMNVYLNGIQITGNPIVTDLPTVDLFPAISLQRGQNATVSRTLVNSYAGFSQLI